MNLRSVRDADVAGKRVLVRVDFNVPFDKAQGKPHIVDDTRIKAALPTLELLTQKGASHITLVTHMGRPEGKVVESLRVAPIAARLRELGVAAELLENVRFDPREEANDPALAKELALLADVFVNDAFAAAHRAHSSTVGVAALLPSYAGLLVEEEVRQLSQALTPPPGAVAIIALTKEDKKPLVEKLATLYSEVLVGGPVSHYAAPTPNVRVPVDGVPELEGLLDIGPTTLATYLESVCRAPFVLWNGPLGWYEKGYTKSTDAIAEAIIANDTAAVIGGGDTVNALKKFSFNKSKVFISTGGGAMLEFLAEGTLPALEVLKR